MIDGLFRDTYSTAVLSAFPMRHVRASLPRHQRITLALHWRRYPTSLAAVLARAYNSPRFRRAYGKIMKSPLPARMRASGATPLLWKVVTSVPA
jgi:hypothetical protein